MTRSNLTCSIASQGIKATRSTPNPYLYQALALMATELGYTEEARQWFMEGTKTLLVCSFSCMLLKHDGIILPSTLICWLARVHPGLVQLQKACSCTSPGCSGRLLLLHCCVSSHHAATAVMQSLPDFHCTCLTSTSSQQPRDTLTMQLVIEPCVSQRQSAH